MFRLLYSELFMDNRDVLKAFKRAISSNNDYVESLFEWLKVKVETSHNERKETLELVLNEIELLVCFV